MDWKKTRKNTWINTKKGETVILNANLVFIEKHKQRKVLIKTCKTKSEAIKFTKKYTR